MNKIKYTTEIIRYIDDCKKCGRKIHGSTQGQVEWNMMIHQKSKGCKPKTKELRTDETNRPKPSN